MVSCSSLCWINKTLNKNKQKLKSLLFWEVLGVQLSFWFVFRSFSSADLDNLVFRVYKVGFAFLGDSLLYFLQLNPCIKTANFLSL